MMMTLKHTLHPSQPALNAIVALRLFSAGKGDAASAIRALHRLELIYGHPIKCAVALFKRSLSVSDKAVQERMLFEALDHIVDWVFRNPVKAAIWEKCLKGWHTLKDKALFIPAPQAMAA